MLSVEKQNEMPEWMGNQGLLCPYCHQKNPLSAYQNCRSCGKQIFLIKNREEV